MSETGESFLAGVLEELPALTAIGAPSVASYLRLRPAHWAGAFQCWGRENREAAMRFVTGLHGTESVAANCEIKCFDQSANVYLVTGAVIAAGLSGIERGSRLPAESTRDPGRLSSQELAAAGITRLPLSLGQAISALERSDVLREAMGDMLFEALRAVRLAELEAFDGAEPDAVLAAHRFRY
jgi:glutamine synthetase